MIQTQTWEKEIIRVSDINRNIISEKLMKHRLRTSLFEVYFPFYNFNTSLLNKIS